MDGRHFQGVFHLHKYGIYENLNLTAVIEEQKEERLLSIQIL